MEFINSLSQYSDVGLYLVRLVVALVFLYHGLPKLLNAKGMAQMMGMPVMMPVVLGLLEVAASVGLVLGVYVELSALVLAIVMLGAILMKIMKWHSPFNFMKGGWEFDLVLLVVALSILFGNGGTIALV